ncbi:two-component system, OmpR family, sensor histidine kinase VicK [Seinonella peptonophila]|uniref:histidine kinase n=1 Tax=Seinonella peptonophila TaxID=112248 RepID=A0A1M4WXF3_9BACL|nr:ATP-binding protein [Seinonella peptonophila]SHE85733.1 two-component system, OmpR family, sensor histidine kinase VicK [Seinonella peptonophila]
MQNVKKSFSNWFDSVNSLQWKLVIIYLLLIIIAMQLIGAYFFRSLEDEYVSDLQKDLQSQASLLENPLRDTMQQDHSLVKTRAEIDKLLKRLVYLKLMDKTSPNIEIQITDEKGFVITTTGTNRNIIGNKNVRLNQIKPNRTNIRRDTQTGKDYLVYKHEIVNDKGIPVGTIYMEASLEKTYSTIRSISNHFIQITALSLFVTAFLVIILARTITTPVKEVTAQATAMASGDFDRKVDVHSKDEIGQLGTAFNHLASHLRKALSANEEEKGKLESVLAHMSDGVIATDNHGKIIVKNQQAERLLGQTIQLGESIHDTLTLGQPISLPLTKKRQSLVERSNDDPEEQTIIKTTFTPITRQDQEPIGIVAVLEDVTEQEKLDRQRKDFVANVSHELRTPLTTIKSYLEALSDGAMEEPELATRFLQVTQQEAERMSRLINDLLHLSRLDAQKIKIQKKAMRIDNILQSAADRFSLPAEQKQVHLSCTIEEKLPQVYIDPDLMDRVLDNLISNAVKYTSTEGTITIHAHRLLDGSVEVSIRDTGIGIPKKDLDRIFERFYRVDKARSRDMGGTGLGLSIAKEIVEVHGGEIAIHSTYKKGTTVSFTLPPFEPEVIR